MAQVLKPTRRQPGVVRAGVGRLGPGTLSLTIAPRPSAGAEDVGAVRGSDCAAAGACWRGGGACAPLSGPRFPGARACRCPTPCTLHPTPYTLHPTPYTLYPLGLRVEGSGSQPTRALLAGVGATQRVCVG